ncbi:hypothetical protein D3C84_749350 [compost metagenome]
MWCLTVFSLINSRDATSRLVSPFDTSRMTSSSRLVRSTLRVSASCFLMLFSSFSANTGVIYDSPLATDLIAWTRSGPLTPLSTYPRAPDSRARKASSSDSETVSINTFTCGSCVEMNRTAANTSPGMLTSISITSGRTLSAISRASCASAPCSTT